MLKIVNSWAKRVLIGLLLIPVNHLAAAEQKTAVIVADSRKLTGVTAWIANLFNESHLYFAILTVVSIPLAGMILGSVADVLMGRIGINLKSRALREG